MTDNDIIELYFSRNEDAIRCSEEKYGTYCLAVASNIVSSEDAKECVNDTWLGAWNSIPPKHPLDLKLFFAKITRNLAYNKFRMNSTVRRGGGQISAVLDELSDVISHDDIESRIEGMELTRSINAFLAALDVRERGIFIRRYFFVEATADIARRYAISKTNVLTVLSRTRKKLKRHLEKEGYTV